MDKFTFGSNLSFGKVKERVQAAQHDFTTSFKNIADKAKKETKILNKKARKALATEDGGDLRKEYVLTVNLDAGYDLFKRFQGNWAVIHQTSVENVKKAQEVEQCVNAFAKQWQKWHTYLLEFHGNLLMLPDAISKVEAAQKQIEAIGIQTKKIEELILEYEDTCERYIFEKQKSELKLKLSQLVETKSAEYTFKKSMMRKSADGALVELSLSSTTKTTVQRNPVQFERQKSCEKQIAYEDAFLNQMNQYIQYGALEKPIAGSVITGSNIEDIEIEDSDWSTLSEFLGPEELDSVKQAHSAASVKRESKLISQADNKDAQSEIAENNDVVNIVNIDKKDQEENAEPPLITSDFVAENTDAPSVENDSNITAHEDSDEAEYFNADNENY